MHPGLAGLRQWGQYTSLDLFRRHLVGGHVTDSRINVGTKVSLNLSERPRSLAIRPKGSNESLPETVHRAIDHRGCSGCLGSRLIAFLRF